MHVRTLTRIVAPLVSVTAGLSLCGPLQAQPPANKANADKAKPAEKDTRKVRSEGNFTDKAGAKFHWEVNSSHALVWNGSPYIPVGGRFTAHSLGAAGDKGWDSDKKKLDELKAKGVLDLLISPEGSLANCSAASIQRLVDYLDANGFRYGVGFGSGMEAPLYGVVIKPNSYRYDSTPGQTAQFTVADSARAFYYVVDTTDKDLKLLRTGQVRVQDGNASVPIELPQAISHALTLLYPLKTIPAGRSATMPDLWGGFDDYRDRIIGILGQVKFGSGLRFFSDPLAKSLSLDGELDYLIPLSDGFQLEFEAFLSRQYPTVDEVKSSWDILESKYKTHAELAKLIPLWANGRGAPYLLDPSTGATMRINDSIVSKWWDDFLQCRAESVRTYMNQMAGALKRHVADIPVTYTWTQTHPIFLNTEKEVGFDGLSVVSRLGDAAALPRSIAPAYSLAEQAGRTMWATVSNVESGDRGANATQSNLAYELDRLRRVGFKGFYSGELNGPAEQTLTVTTPLPLGTTSLDWLKTYQARVDAERSAARYAPNVLFFPFDKPGPAKIGWAPGDPSTLWLNSIQSGEALDWWPAVQGYTIKNGESTQFVMTTPFGARRVRFVLPNPKGVTVTSSNGAPIATKIISRSEIEIPLDSRPVVVNVPVGRLFPEEAATDIYLQLNALFQLGMSQKVASIENERPVVERTGFYLKRKDFEGAYYQARSTVDELTYLTSPYIWIEGEEPYEKRHTFTEVATNVEASNGQYLRLQTSNPPGRAGYGARYVFNVQEDGRYNIWISASIPGPNVSPIRWRMNSDPEQDPQEERVQGELYGGERFGWRLLGTVDLKKGQAQKFSLYVADKAQSGEWNFAVDAILLTRKTFLPNGKTRPLPIDLATLKTYKDIGTSLHYNADGK